MAPTGVSSGRPCGRWTRAAAAGGIIGPTAFVGAWAVGSAAAPGYSAVDDAISRLAAVGADTRPLMTAGFVTFGVGVSVFAASLRRAVSGPAWIAAAATGVAIAAVAAIPLDRSAAGDTWHAIAAAAGYVTVAATPALAARPLLAQGQRGLARLGVLSSSVAAAALLASVTGLPTGLFQRIGLTAGDAWIAAAALAIARGHLGAAAAHRWVGIGGPPHPAAGGCEPGRRGE
jgi:hypothetical membrane protein